MHAELNGIELHYEIAGEGEPLLWLHGFLGCGADWRHVFGAPPEGYRVIAPDPTVGRLRARTGTRPAPARSSHS